MAINFRDPRVIKITVGLIVMLIMLISWYFTSFRKHAQIIKLRADELERLQMTLNEAKRNASRFPQIKAECQKIFDEYKTLELLMPPKRDDPEFLNKIHSAAKNTGVLIKGINVIASTKTDFYVVNPYEVSLSGSFFSLGNFLADMANYSVTTNFSDIQIAYTKKEVGYHIDAQLVIKTYSIPDEEVLKTPEALKIEPQLIYTPEEKTKTKK